MARPHADAKYLSYLLRHGANEAGLTMDAAGWANVADIRAVSKFSEEQIDLAVRNNTKDRLQRDGNRMRACQGHSFAGTPVTREALEASWMVDGGDEDLWHGTTKVAATQILLSGIQPGDRTHVHLARTSDAKVGKRSHVEVLLRVSRSRLLGAGIVVWCAPNDVLLARFVPADCVTLGV
jgi:putative RNA 2'-phosphotransferase